LVALRSSESRWSVGGWQYGHGMTAWFGSLLDWHRDDGGRWVAWHSGRCYRLARSGRRWRFVTHPDAATVDERCAPCGPALASTLAASRELAELWILTPESDHWPAPGSPSVLHTLSGAAFQSDGVSLTACADPARGRIDIREGGRVIGAITPYLQGRSTTLAWRPVAGRELSLASTWHTAVRAVTAAAHIST
jgi:hypothetical protein